MSYFDKTTNQIYLTDEEKENFKEMQVELSNPKNKNIPKMAEYFLIFGFNNK